MTSLFGEYIFIYSLCSNNVLTTIPIPVHRKWFTSVLDAHLRQTTLSKNPSTHLYAFALKYLAVLAKSDDRLVALIEAQTVQSMIEPVNAAFDRKDSLVFNSYMLLLQTLNVHKAGLKYVFQQGLWRNILNAIGELDTPAKYVEIQSSQYIADLIHKSFVYEIPEYCEPLIKELFYKLNSTDCLVANQQVNKFSSYNIYLKTLILSLEKFIGTTYERDVHKQIIEKHTLSDVLINIRKLLDINPLLLKNYMTLRLLFDCFTVWHNSNLECILKSFFSCMSVPTNIQSYKQLNNLYTQAITYAITSKNTQLSVDAMFEKELIAGQLTPLRKCSEWLRCSNYEKLTFDCSSVIESNCILNFCNNYDSAINEVAISSILNIIDIAPTLKQESLDYLAAFFSTLTNRFLHSDDWLEQHDSSLVCCKFLEILSYVFICWTKVLEYKLLVENITQSLLSVPLVHNHSEFFDKSSHGSTLLQNGLKLISTALNKGAYKNVPYADNTKAFDRLCASLNNMLLDTRPEIRDSCLQCISSVTAASTTSSGYFLIKLLLEKRLPIAVLNTLKHDNDPFVRAKALECLEKMVSVKDIWDASLKESDLMTLCLNLMQCESEGIIRRQIVKLITALFSFNELSDKMFNEICVVMVHITIKDPLWEVKTFTYEFWGCVIKKLFALSQTEGCSEHLVKLSSTGCLHVLYVALIEEHDLVVQKNAIRLTKELLSSLNSLNSVPNSEPKITSVSCTNPENDSVVDNTCSKHKKIRQVDSADRILNSITTANDCELLPSLKFANSSNIYPSNVCLRQKTDVYISVKDFIHFTSSYNFNDCDIKTQWVISTRSGLDSMLDDIISQSQNCFVEGADSLDCH